jgi:hypothetical protein
MKTDLIGAVIRHACSTNALPALKLAILYILGRGLAYGDTYDITLSHLQAPSFSSLLAEQQT